MLETTKQRTQERMHKSVEALKIEFTKIRTGRAHSSLLDHVFVPYYGHEVPLNQTANVTALDPRTLGVTPYEKTMLTTIEKAIRDSDLGLNPTNVGTVLRIPLPPMTEERRKELVKVVRHEAEEARIAIRNIRRDANQELKHLVKDKTLSEDEERRGQETIQKITDSYITSIDELLAEKEKELMEV
ncbi:MAG: ribosome recycling factor [Pseudomonadota bacterium]|nr:ribosome recycling factor [Pseudomonadota bacterium]